MSYAGIAVQRTASLPLAYARVPINLGNFLKMMDGRIKSGHDDGGAADAQFCSLTPSITTVEAELAPAMLESRISRRRVPLIQRLRVSL